MTGIDKDWNHLYPAFRSKLEEVLRQARQKTGHAWVLSEGYRSQERQLWLYAQGRTRPGPIVTWLKTPKHHGVGLAADCYPSSNGTSPDFSLPHANYAAYRTIYRAQGLENPAWVKGDYGHVQWPASDAATHLKAGTWCRNGFQAPAPPPPPAPAPEAPATPGSIPVYVDDELLTDAGAVRKEGQVLVMLRPVVEALDWSILSTSNNVAVVSDDLRSVSVPFELRAGRAYTPVRPLCELLQVRCDWDGSAVRIA
jgi:hypothetical protein